MKRILKKNVMPSLLVGLADLGTIMLSFICLAALLRSFAGKTWQNYTVILHFHAVLSVVLLYSFELYAKPNRKKYDIILSTFLIVIITNVVSVLVEYSLMPEGVYRLTLFTLPVFEFIFLLTWRLILAVMIRNFFGKQNLLVITAQGINNDMARKIKYSCLHLFNSWYTYIDVTDKDAIAAFIQGEFTQYECIFITPSIPESVKKHLVSEAVLAEKEIFVLPNLYDINLTKYEMFQFDDTPALRIKTFKISEGQRLVKRVCDLILSAAGLILSSPIMLLAAIAIKLTSKGTVLYSQERVTKDRKVFKIYKFRTMVQDAEKQTGPVLAKGGTDDRITKVGRLLRLTRLDELPQLFNIFKGEMSMVGPRPERPFFVDKFCETIENYDKRYTVKAGLTGYAQIYGRYDTNAGDKLLYDLLYIREYSLWLDLKIMLLTVKTVFIRESAEGADNVFDSSTLKQGEQSGFTV